MRDGLLAIDGTLDLTIGGTLQKGSGTDGETSNDRLSLNPEKLKRRTVYLPLRRANLPTLLNLFDFGDATTSSASGKRPTSRPRRSSCSTASSSRERSQNVANAPRRNRQDDAARLRSAYLRILNRQPAKRRLSRG